MNGLLPDAENIYLCDEFGINCEYVEEIGERQKREKENGTFDKNNDSLLEPLDDEFLPILVSIENCKALGLNCHRVKELAEKQ